MHRQLVFLGRGLWGESMAAGIHLTPTERDDYARGRRYFEEGETDLALQCLTRLLETRAGFADIHYMVGVLLERKGDLEGAVDSLRTAIRLNPSYAEALLAMASVHERRGDFDRSREYAQRAVAVSRGAPGGIDATTRGKIANLHAAVADACAEAGDLREAIESYRKALDRCPDFHDIRHRLGTTLREAGLPHQAALEFKRVLRANPSLTDSRVQLGLTYYSMGRTEEARQEWQNVAADEPERSDVAMYLKLVSKDVPAPAPALQAELRPLRPRVTDVEIGPSTEAEEGEPAPLPSGPPL